RKVPINWPSSLPRKHTVPPTSPFSNLRCSCQRRVERLHVGPFRLRFLSKQAVSQAPAGMLPTEKRRVRASSVATTLIDLLRHAATIGGIERAALILRDLAPKLSHEDISESLEAAGDVAAAQRFGYLLDIYGHAKSASRC